MIICWVFFVFPYLCSVLQRKWFCTHIHNNTYPLSSFVEINLNQFIWYNLKKPYTPSIIAPIISIFEVRHTDGGGQCCVMCVMSLPSIACAAFWKDALCWLHVSNGHVCIRLWVRVGTIKQLNLNIKVRKTYTYIVEFLTTKWQNRLIFVMQQCNSNHLWTFYDLVDTSSMVSE